MAERATFRGWNFGLHSGTTPFNFMDGVVHPKYTWQRLGVFAEHVIDTDNSRCADDVSRRFVPLLFARTLLGFVVCPAGGCTCV